MLTPMEEQELAYLEETLGGGEKSPAPAEVSESEPEAFPKTELTPEEEEELAFLEEYLGMPASNLPEVEAPEHVEAPSGIPVPEDEVLTEAPLAPPKPSFRNPEALAMFEQALALEEEWERSQETSSVEGLSDEELEEALEGRTSSTAGSTFERVLRREESPSDDAWWGEIAPYAEEHLQGRPATGVTLGELIEAGSKGLTDLKQDNYTRARGVDPELESWVRAASLAQVEGVFGRNAPDNASITLPNGATYTKDDFQYKTPSTAVGKYQILTTHIADMVERGLLNKQAIFSEEIQDKAAALLIKEKRDIKDYIEADAPSQEQLEAAKRQLTATWEGFGRARVTDQELEEILGELRGRLYAQMLGESDEQEIV